MTQKTIMARARATCLGEEDTFGVTPSGSFPNNMNRAFTLGDADLVEPMTEMLDVNDERSHRAAAVDPVVGLEIGSKVTLKTNLKAVPQAGRLLAAATPAEMVARLFLRQGLGAEHAAAGGLVDNPVSSTEFDIQGGTSAFRKGTWILVTVAGEPEPTKIIDLDSTTVTVSPALSATPADGAVIRQLYNYAPADTHTTTTTVQQAFVGDTAAQWTLNGCAGSLTFELPEYGKLPTMSLALEAVRHTGPTAQSQSTARATDGMGSTFAFRPTVYCATAVDRAVRLVCEGLSIESPNTWQSIRDGGGIETVAGKVNTAGRPRMVTAKLSCRFDSAWETSLAARTAYQLIIVQKIGSGATSTFWIWEVPCARLVAAAKPTKVGELLFQELTFNGTPDESVTFNNETGIPFDFVNASYRVAFG